VFFLLPTFFDRRVVSQLPSDFEIIQVKVYNQVNKLSLIRLIHKPVANLTSNKTSIIKTGEKFDDILMTMNEIFKILKLNNAVLLDKSLLINVTTYENSYYKKKNFIITFGIAMEHFSGLDEVCGISNLKSLETNIFNLIKYIKTDDD